VDASDKKFQLLFVAEIGLRDKFVEAPAQSLQFRPSGTSVLGDIWEAGTTRARCIDHERC
jgi:hypothetical protein